MNSEMAQAAKGPAIFFVSWNSYQMRHDVDEPAVMVAFDPHYFDAAFRIRKLADTAQEFPVIFVQTAKIQVGKDVAKKDETLEGEIFQ